MGGFCNIPGRQPGLAGKVPAELFSLVILGWIFLPVALPALQMCVCSSGADSSSSASSIKMSLMSFGWPERINGLSETPRLGGVREKNSQEYPKSLGNTQNGSGKMWEMEILAGSLA